MKSVIKIDIVSDVVCPWCYIGKRRIEQAMKTLENDFDFDVSYLPFELNPHTPSEGFNQKEHLIGKFGGEEKYNQIASHVTRVAAEEGLQFHFDKQQISPNTSDLHRIIWFAKKEGKQAEVKEVFMKAYFEQGVDLTTQENIIAVAASAGLDAARVNTLLNSQEGLEEVNHLEQLNYQRGVSGVPFYIVNNQYAISGAQPSDVFVKALKQIGTELNMPQGETCDVDTENC